ncbi:MAG: CAP domain-containing protein [Kaiparowitsia implicata GSE-PSE-MK54-09C]|jgi:uncharacterized protein YkwD|nr:CAP domain-containing protein [Kaiparowitsia implicata GSE-PSE-MK54-09C]
MNRWMLLGLSSGVLLLATRGGSSFLEQARALSITDSAAAPPSEQLVATSRPELGLTSQERVVFEQINAYRQTRGLEPLELDPVITRQARLHSDAMAAQGQLSHDGFQSRVQEIGWTVTYSNASENVAFSQGFREPGAQAVQGWINSPGHRQNLEGRYDVTGIGASHTTDGRVYFTQIFIRRR